MIEENIMNEIVDIIQFHPSQNGVHWLDTIEYIKEKLLSEITTTHKADNNMLNNTNKIVSPNRYLDNRENNTWYTIGEFKNG